MFILYVIWDSIRTLWCITSPERSEKAISENCKGGLIIALFSAVFRRLTSI
ncbi:MAG: hypothetical protein K2H28_09225 [Ruminococcus sp.]|nr:hypothetical protein [Ruminococcus sp.]